MVFKSASPFLLIRLAGITLPGKLAFVRGSRTRMSAPPGFSDCEKSPALSRAVGSVCTDGVEPAEVLGLLSKLKKKKSFWRAVLKSFGMVIGPPMATPFVLKR